VIFYVLARRTNQGYADAPLLFATSKLELANGTSQVGGRVLPARFLAHQPISTYADIPRCREEMLNRCSNTSGWDMGADGFRLDAVPFLFEAGASRARACHRKLTPSAAVEARVEASGRDVLLLPRRSSRSI